MKRPADWLRATGLLAPSMHKYEKAEPSKKGYLSLRLRVIIEKVDPICGSLKLLKRGLK